MRLLFAGLFVCVSLFSFAMLASKYTRGDPPWLLTFIIFFGVLAVAYFLFNPRGTFSSPDRLKQMGLLSSQSFHARRAFQVAEWGDEGLHYFIELEDGHVLYLTGQYLYEYEPLADEPDEAPEPRRFPVTQFTIHRHRKEGYVVQMDLDGKVIEPEASYPAFSRQEYGKKWMNKDGLLITDCSYDDLKAERERLRLEI